MTHRAIDKLRKSGAKRPRVLVLTTSYPSDDQDPSGIFIAKLLRAIKERGYSIKVVAPSNGSFYGRRLLDGIEMVTVRLFSTPIPGEVDQGRGRHSRKYGCKLFGPVSTLPHDAGFPVRCAP